MRLGVNVDHIATLREARKGREPDPVQAAVLAELGGADGITVHLRGDRRHIKERDIEILGKTVTTHLNVEMAATEEMATLMLSLLPHQVTLVAERREEITTEGGLDAVINQSHLQNYIQSFHSAGIKVSLFIDPDKEQIRAAHRIGVKAIEINTTKFSEAGDRDAAMNELVKLKEVAKFAGKLGLETIAGLGLNYRNILLFRQIPEVTEVNIGHSIIARAAFVGLERAVREMKALLSLPSPLYE